MPPLRSGSCVLFLVVSVATAFSPPQCLTDDDTFACLYDRAGFSWDLRPLCAREGNEWVAYPPPDEENTTIIFNV